MSDPSFTEFLHEGTGDVDVLYGNSRPERREHIQIKDHPIARRGELKEIIDIFAAVDRGMPGTYNRFTLACPLLGAKLQPLRNALNRYRDAKMHFKSAPGSMKRTLADVKKRIAELGLIQHRNFIVEKVYFHVGLADLHDDKAACGSFAIKLQEHPTYKRVFTDLAKAAYQPLLHEVRNNRGKAIHRVAIQGLIEKALKTDVVSTEPVINLDIHNWTVEKYGSKANYVLDWSAYFDRDTRKVPDERVWNEQLLPQLSILKKKILTKTTARLIRLRGKNTLTTGLALGAMFPEIGNWAFEIQQPPQPLPWRSDAVPDIRYDLKVGDDISFNKDGDSIAFVFNIKGDALRDVRSHITTHSLAVKAIIPVEPAGAPGGQSIANDREAVSLALRARDVLHNALARHDVRITHLFFYGPFALSVFIGQLLTSIGRIQLYEFKDPGYAPSAILRT